MGLLNGVNTLGLGAPTASRKQLQEEKSAGANATANYMGNLNIGSLLNGSANPPSSQEASASRL